MADAPTPSNPAAQVLSQARALWAKQPRGRKTLAIAVVLGVFAIVAWTQLVPHGPAWQVVADGASPDDSQELMATLESRGITAHLDGGKVVVQAERLDEARAVAASAGLPRTGKGLELFDATNLGQSSFAEQVNYVRALQGELARSISALAQVENARVHLALGKQSVFKDQEQGPSASVALHLHMGQQLTAEQVRGVRQLVAASVQGLKPEAVVIVDSHGNLLDSADPDAVDRKAEIERSVTLNVRTMLERVVGAGKVSVVTTADVDEGKVSETQELYDADHPAVRSETHTIEGADATSGIGGVAGARGNLPGAPAPSPAPGAPQNSHVQETKNYELSRTVRQTVKPDVQLKRLHVAVVVDAKTGSDGKPAPRSDKELAELTAIARQAAGIDDTRGDKIEVHSLAFAEDPEAAVAAALPPSAAALPVPLWMIGAGGGLVAIIALALILRRRGKGAAAAAAGTLALPAPVGEIERALEARPSLAMAAAPADMPNLLPGRTVRDRVVDAVRGDVDRTAEVLTAWLAEPPRRGAK
ncbi:MAG TPA: flagellar basal-body MS-ring/collar protein FliF [Kofleriaceae bacterium]|nr:flagellar basal-body MS-ring/collar protein FliF [Kofleriaceae bacterium]